MFAANYTPPVSGTGEAGNYTKIGEGDTVRLRILSEALTGYVYWTNENKPVRASDRFAATPNIREGDKQKHFWAVKVFNYNTKQIEIWEITQVSIRDLLWSYLKDEDYGDLRNFDLKISRSGKALDTKYTVIAGAVKAADAAILTESEAHPVDLTALYRSKNPFGKAAVSNFDDEF